jgi:hypothetical protein
LEIQQEEDEAERETRFLDDMEARIAFLSSSLEDVGDDYDVGSPREVDLVSLSDITPSERPLFSREPLSQAPSLIPAPSDSPPPSRAPFPSPRHTEGLRLPRLDLGKVRDGLTV